MLPTYVVVVDSTRARFFTPEMADGAAGELTVQLAEKKTLINADRLVRPSEIFAGSRTEAVGRNNGQTFIVDDHRERHLLAIERRFTADIVEELSAFTRNRPDTRVLIAAGPHMLGLLREALDGRLEPSRIIEHNADLSHLRPAQILEHLRPALRR